MAISWNHCVLATSGTASKMSVAKPISMVLQYVPPIFVYQTEF